MTSWATASWERVRYGVETTRCESELVGTCDALCLYGRDPTPLALQLRSMRRRALACRCQSGVFPVNYRDLSSIGLHIHLDDLRSLSQKNMINVELRKIRIALTVLPCIPERDCFTALES